MTISNQTNTDNDTVNQLFDKPQRRNVSSSKKSVIHDPLVSINERLEKLTELTALVKDTKNEIDVIKNTFESDLKSFLDNDDDKVRPMITHTTDKNKKVYLQIRKTYKYSDKLVEKRTRIENLKADLKAAEEKAVRENKAVLVKEDFTVVFKN